MVKEIRIYVEGGGDGPQTKALVREGFSSFLESVIKRARERRIRWEIIACGSRNSAYDAYQLALNNHSEAFNMLLVDAECPISEKPWKHLRKNDNWELSENQNDCCHLMVQVFENWLIADIEALRHFYGSGFQTSSLSFGPNVENISKSAVYSALKKATRHTQKGEYDKIHHGSKILKLVDVPKVRAAAPHCERLFSTLSELMGTDS